MLWELLPSYPSCGVNKQHLFPAYARNLQLGGFLLDMKPTLLVVEVTYRGGDQRIVGVGRVLCRPGPEHHGSATP